VLVASVALHGSHHQQGERFMAAKKGLIGEFIDFVKSGDLVSVAAAFIIGTATAALVTSFTKNIAMGILGLFVKCKDIIGADGKPTGTQDCSGLVGKAWKSVGWGNFINDAITYLFTMLVVFMIIKAYRKAVPDKQVVGGPSDNDLLKEIRDSLKSR
jgi:large conductance mechanosensitive channel